jgi:hypothetical protein
MKGATAGNDWPDTAAVLDLNTSNPRWTSVPQPFKRRALIAAVLDGKVYAIGGFDEHDKPSLRVDVLDPITGKWSTAPDLPGPARNGFAPAACTLDGTLYVSVADGSLARLVNEAKAWERVAKTTPRIVHRLVPHDGAILAIGGAAKGENLDLVERVAPSPRP